MIRYAAAALLPAMLFLMTPAPVNAQFPQPGRGRGWDEIVGDYINKSGGGECYITRSGRGYTFVNERLAGEVRFRQFGSAGADFR
jgi:hypothetical protein